MSPTWLDLSPIRRGHRKAESSTGEAPRPRTSDKRAPDEPVELSHRLAWRIAALLLDYPTRQTLDMLDELHSAARTLPVPAGPALVSFVAELRRRPPMELAAHYVETFDLRRRHCLHLSYYAFGDTRKRGMALLRFKHAYTAAGATLGEHELPDHLAVVLEFAATVDPVAGRALLVEYRPVVELLRMSLQEIGSPYLAVLEAVSVTLPVIDPADRRRVAELAAQGPPEEEVGLEPYGVDPMMAERMEGRR